MTTADQAALTGADRLRAATADYWRAVMAPSMKVEIPDETLRNLVPASQVHCMIASHNEQGVA